MSQVIFGGGGLFPEGREELAPKGIKLVYETGVEVVRSQMETFQQLDTKLSVVWGFLSTVLLAATGFATSDSFARVVASPTWSRPLHLAAMIAGFWGLLLLAAGLVCAVNGFRPRAYSHPVNFTALLRDANLSEGEIRHRAMDTIRTAIIGNVKTLETKVRWLRWALRLGTIGVLIVVLAALGLTASTTRTGGVMLKLFGTAKEGGNPQPQPSPPAPVPVRPYEPPPGPPPDKVDRSKKP